MHDIFVSTTQFSAVGGGTSAAAEAILAGVIGLVTVGLILLVVALASRRRSGIPAKERPAKAPAPIT